MNRRHRIAYVVAAALAALLVGMLVQRDAQAQRHAPAAPPRWEYATLRFEFLKDSWAWNAPDGVKRGSKHKLYRDLGGVGRSEDQVSYVDVANQAGSQSWEVAHVLEREDGTEIWFRRPVR